MRPKPTRALLSGAAAVVSLYLLAACGGTAASAPGGVGTSGASPQERSRIAPAKHGISRPIRISGRNPVYTQEALEAGIEGLMVVKCVIRTSGELTGCRVIKSLPYLDQEVLDATRTWRYTPVLFKGKPTAVDYVFNLRFRLPPRPPPQAVAPGPVP
ncbi:energy transducer TonB [Sorangium sp. So ce131]|uniref:energy transducer TonB n=1 Tax=Sorangium sp. So ce131 TaxID=3133282 RepID=UPI003F621EB1